MISIKIRWHRDDAGGLPARDDAGWPPKADVGREGPGREARRPGRADARHAAASRVTALPRVLGLPGLALLALGSVLGAAPSAAQEGGEEVRIEVTHVSGSVYMLRGRGGNIGASVGEDGTLLVDDQFAPLAPQIRAAVDSLGNGGVSYVLNTHWHHDHTDGNKVFGREAPVVAHRNVRLRLASPQVSGSDTTPALPEHALPVITFDEGVSIHFNGEEIRVEHLPRGHTDGDAVVYFPASNVVHMGDQMFAGRFPFVDLASGGSVQGYTRNVERVLETVAEDAAVVPGHGGLTDVEGLRDFHAMLVETTEIVRRRMQAGRSLEEIQAAGLPERWESWGQGFISTSRWLETIYRSLARAAS